MLKLLLLYYIIYYYHYFYYYMTRTAGSLFCIHGNHGETIERHEIVGNTSELPQENTLLNVDVISALCCCNFVTVQYYNLR